MKIVCPNCNAGGTIPDHEISDQGRFLNCPRCQHGFTIKKPRPEGSAYQVDTCPSCNFNTFGDESFSTCPKCGVVVKVFVERQRDEAQRLRDQELLAKKFSHNEAPLPSERETRAVADFIETLHPVNLVEWGTYLVAVIMAVMGLWGVVGYYGSDIQEQLSAQREEPVSDWYVFLHYGAMHWVQLLYGLALLATGMLLTRRRAQSLKILSQLLWGAIFFVPVYFVTGFVVWIMEPIPHSISGYIIEVVNIALMTGLWCIPLFLLIRFLADRRITSVVKQ
ncbi:MAG: zinc-ribbon domain-containing protein [Oryzomonas sp.]|uniref:zinc-ribbon domain-containing protein n=1 Tax=Oryzomonas sp. TaxID=2855186 RepID=UPI002845A568|nr:zinc-ribbon domain-containing protein [Oryzomonas sp.]MDR3581485.1 zinc-ribbon domain-containing protein [Oryzomonas sp.]